MSKLSAALLALAVVAVTGLVAYRLHLTHSRFHLAPSSDGALYRIDRLTGLIEKIGERGVTSLDDHSQTPRLETMPSSELQKLEGDVRLSDDGYIIGTFYNGSAEWNVRRLTLRLTPLDSSGDIVWTREYADDVQILAQSDGLLMVLLMDSKGATDLRWSIVKAEGTPSP